jgi:hypothetical protein
MTKPYTPETLAAEWQCTARHIRNLVNTGELRGFRLGDRLLRIPQSAVEVPKYSIGRLKGRFVVNVYADCGKRTNRYRLNARDKGEAEREAPGVVAALTRPVGKSVREIWDAFTADRAGRAIIATMVHTWKALESRFGSMVGDEITVDDCRAHTMARRKVGIKDGSISTELGHLRMVLRWAEKRGMIRAPYIERPVPPRRKEVYLTRAQCRALIDAATMPHIRLYILLALATGGRNEALLDLTWDRCDFERGRSTCAIQKSIARTKAAPSSR